MSKSDTNAPVQKSSGAILNQRRTLIILFVVWLGWTAAGFWYFQFRWIQDFDPDQSLLERFPDFNVLENRLLDQFQAQNKSRTLFVITDKSCRCNRFIQSHLQDLKAETGDVTEFVDVSLADLSVDARELVPSTPAAVILNNRQQLEYFGPLNSGVQCTSESSYIEELLKSEPASNSQFNLIARGCYCS